MTAPAPVVNGRTLDRVPRWDTKNELYRVSPRVEIPEDFSRDRVTWLDQGSEGGCVGFSGTTVMSFGDPAHPELDAANAEWLYSLAKDNDEYPGRDYEGSSVLGSAKGLLKSRLVRSYYWAKTVDEVCTAIALHAAVNFGIDWYQGMFDPDSNGLIAVSGSKAGGHAIASGAYKGRGELVRLDNTWGRSWGVDGSAWIKGEDLQTLLDNQGECAVFLKMADLSSWGQSARVDPDSSGGVVNPAS